MADLLQQHQAQSKVKCATFRVQVTDVTDEQSRADADVEQVKSRQQRDQSMVDSGAISDPKALERMLGELESLAKRISDLEDVELEVMERLEQLQGSARRRVRRSSSYSRGRSTRPRRHWPRNKPS
ncbi:MAG: hypothetical protein V9G13_10260 [Marmoricola sp.]